MALKAQKGFTLVELLVVIGIIALLISILLPTLSKARERAQSVKCMAQLRNLGQSVFMYAGENRGKVPQHLAKGRTPNTDLPTWLWDVAKDTRDALVKKGGSRATLYCPLFYEQNVEDLWEGTFGRPPLPLTNARNYSVLGYVWMGRRPDGQAGMVMNARAYIDSLKPPQPEKTGTNATGLLTPYFPRVAAETELAADAIVRDASTDLTHNWAVTGGWSDMHMSSHLSKGVPTGANVLFLDGHVAFRAYKGLQSLGNKDVIAKRATLNNSINFWF